jgi:hypothetical protein
MPPTEALLRSALGVSSARSRRRLVCPWALLVRPNGFGSRSAWARNRRSAGRRSGDTHSQR